MSTKKRTKPAPARFSVHKDAAGDELERASAMVYLAASKAAAALAREAALHVELQMLEQFQDTEKRMESLLRYIKSGCKPPAKKG